MFVVTVEFGVSRDHVGQFREAMIAQAANSLELEEGCVQFDVCFDADDESKCFLYERYVDRSAFDAHLASDHFKEFDSKVATWVESKTVATWHQHER